MAGGEVEGLAAGSYRISVTPQDMTTGSYALRAFVIPTPDEFSVSLPVMVISGAGAPTASGRKKSLGLRTGSVSTSSGGRRGLIQTSFELFVESEGG